MKLERSALLVVALLSRSLRRILSESQRPIAQVAGDLGVVSANAGCPQSAACGARDERVGLYSCSCDAVIDDIFAADRGLSMCGRGCAVTTDWSGDGQADLCGDRLA
jgi:hypothetical protein